jgi:hypothetical protein
MSGASELGDNKHEFSILSPGFESIGKVALALIILG